MGCQIAVSEVEIREEAQTRVENAYNEEPAGRSKGSKNSEGKEINAMPYNREISRQESSKSNRAGKVFK